MVVQSKPTIFLHENVPQFPVEVLTAIAGKGWARIVGRQVGRQEKLGKQAGR